MAGTRGRRSVEQQIEATKAKLKALRVAQKTKAKAKAAGKAGALTKESEGMAALFAAMDTVARAHGMKVPEVIKNVARIRRTGLKIENAKRPRKSAA